ncbi:MAG: NAD(P)/FAD-dependent oxidoreductase, partial [Limisphaerales bacterium]
MRRQRIIIVGGGFGGVKCAKVLSRELSPSEVEVVLFNRENHLVFSPLLAEAVGSSINPLDAVVPLRQLLPRVFCRTEEVKGIDLGRHEVEYETEECQLCRMAYDQLVLACGSAANLHVVPGMADYAFPLKNIADAIALRSHIMEEMEKAEVCSNRELRRRHLTFIVVGGGFTGAE